MDAPRKTEFEQQRFFDECLSRYRKAAEHTGTAHFDYNVGGIRLRLSFAGPRLIPILTPALEHLRTFNPKEPEAIFHIWDSESSGVEMVPPPCARSAFTDRGDIWGFNSVNIRTAWHWSDFSVNVMDRRTQSAVFWVQTARAIPYWTSSAPLRTLFHWLMELHGAQLLHAAAIGNEHGALLITGKGGVGKSTTALSCLEAGMQYLGDDYLFVRLDPEPAVFCLYSTAKLKWDDLRRFPRLASLVAEKYQDAQEKAVLFLHPTMKEQITERLPLRAVLTPELSSEQESRISEIPYWKIQGSMSFTTLSQLPYAGKDTHAFISLICQRLPIFSLHLGKDLRKIPEALSGLLSRPRESEATGAGNTADIPGPRPLISVIMPVFNGEAFIHEALENILAQAYPALEIIIVDDGSTDHSAEIIQSLGVDLRYFRQDNAGPAAARNRGIRDASGEFIAFLDVDDLWPANNLAYLLHELLERPEALAVHGMAQVMEKQAGSGEYEYTGNPGEAFPGYIGAGLYRREVFSRVGLFDPLMRFGEDADWFKRAEEMDIPIHRMKEVTLFVRRHGGNMTEGKDLVELNALKVFKKSLDRRRGAFAGIDLEGKDRLPLSVVIPCYNSEAYLAEAIASILSQQCIPEEVIVVDDGSMDGSARIVEAYPPPLRVIRQANQGAAAARNRGIREAQSAFLAFLDADDLWMPGMPALLLQCLQDDLDLDMVFGHVEQFISPELDPQQHAALRPELKQMPGYLMGSMVIRREAFERVGPLNEELQLGEFIDWFMRAEGAGLKHKVIEQVVMKRRLHTTNLGILKKDRVTDYAAVARAALKRRRESPEEGID